MKKHLSLALIVSLALPCTHGFSGQWNKDIPELTDVRRDYVADVQASNDGLDRMLSKYQRGMLLTYTSGSTITVEAGEIMVSNAAGSVRLMMNNTSSTSVTFADLDTGSEAASTTYYVYALADLVTSETATFKISTSSTAPDSETYYQRIGSFYNDSNSNITRIVNDNGKQVRELQSKTANATYQALTDGQVEFFGCDYTVRGQQFEILSDNESTPTTSRGKDGSGVDQGSGALLSIDVKAGDYYKTTFSSTDSCTATVNFIPNY